MEDFLKPSFWVSATLLAFLVNLTTPYIRDYMKRFWSKSSEKRIQAAKLARAQRESQIQELLEDSEKVAFLRFEITNYNISMVKCLIVMASGILVGLTVSSKNPQTAPIDYFLGISLLGNLIIIFVAFYQLLKITSKELNARSLLEIYQMRRTAAASAQVKK